MATRKKKVLAVDDDPTALAALRQILTQKGYEVTTAANGEEALSLVAAHDFDLALLDVAMPGLSGYEVCRRIRSEERTKDLPVVFLTAKGTVSDMKEGQVAGSDGLTYLAYGTRDSSDICYYPRSNKIFFRGLGLIARLEPLAYADGEPG